MDDEEGAEPAGPEEGLNEQGRRVKSSSLLWFISSRPYVPMPDIRRRFGLYTESGELLHDEDGPVHIGLPRQAAETLLELKRRDKIGLQYDLEYATRIAVGVFPVRVRLLSPTAPARPPLPPAPAVAPIPIEGEGGAAGEGDATASEAPSERSPTRNRRRRKRR